MSGAFRALLSATLFMFPIWAPVQTQGADLSDADLPKPTKKLEDLKFNVTSFTFVRVKHSSYGGARAGRAWATDYPDSDIKLTARFAKDTGLRTDPNGKVLSLTDPQLKSHPFLYIVEPGRLQFSDAEAKALRGYLLGGGFLMVDDFWGEDEWANFATEFKKVFPDREPKELPLDHPVFHSYYKIDKKPQVPNIHVAVTTGGSAERLDAHEVHIRGVTDDNGRLMVIICHNTDLGDGWERQYEDERYTREFSEKKAFPMGVNILVYALTKQNGGR